MHLRTRHVGICTADTHLQTGHVGICTADTHLRTRHVGIRTADTHLQTGHVSIYIAETHLQTGHGGTCTADTHMGTGHVGICTADTHLQIGHIGTCTADTHLQASCSQTRTYMDWPIITPSAHYTPITPIATQQKSTDLLRKADRLTCRPTDHSVDSKTTGIIHCSKHVTRTIIYCRQRMISL